MYQELFKRIVEASQTESSNTQEWGVTSADKVISRINQNLHFFLGNGLYMEEFTEFNLQRH